MAQQPPVVTPCLPPQPAPTVTVVGLQPGLTPAAPTEFYGISQRKAARRLALSQVLMGFLSVVFGIAVCAVYYSDRFMSYFTPNAVTGTGIWVGVFLFVTGFIGVTAARKNSFCWVVSCMVLNIICSIATVVLISMSAAGVGINSDRRCISPYRYLYSSSHRLTIYSNCPAQHALFAMETLLLIIGVAQLIITIICSALGCGATCCKSRGPDLRTVPYQVPSFQQVAAYSAGPQGVSPPYYTPGVPSTAPLQTWPPQQFYSQTPPITAVHGAAPQQVISDEKPPPYQALPRYEQ